MIRVGRIVGVHHEEVLPVLLEDRRPARPDEPRILVALEVERPATSQHGLAIASVVGAVKRRRAPDDESIRRQRARRVALDLSEITLADRASIEFLSQQRKEEIELVNCPAYLETWLARES